MIYVLFRLDWVHGIGYPVEHKFAELGNPVLASEFSESGVQGRILGYCFSDTLPLDVSHEVIGKDEAFSFAHALDSSAQFLNDGRILSTKNLKPSELQELDLENL